MAGSNPPGLKRSMRVTGALLLTLSAVTPASSVFIIVPGVIAQAGTGAFAAMVAAALLSIPIAYVYAELGSAFPIAGGEYCMVGRTVGGGPGFAILALTAFSNLLTPAAFGLGASVYLSAVIPNLNPTHVAIGIILVTTLMGILRIRTNAWITGMFLLLELLALVVLAVLGLWDVKRPLLEIAAHPLWLNNGGLHPTPLAMLGLATSVAIFAYNGFGSTIYFAEEMHEAPRLMARTILWALAITVLTELVPVTAVLLGAPDLKGLLNSQNPFSDFVLARGGPFLNAAICISIALAIFNAILATVLQNARFFYSTGRDGVWHRHVNSAFLNTHARFHSPWIATLVAGLASMAMCFLGINLILVLTGTSIAVIYVAVCIATIAGRRSGASSHAAYRMRFYPFWPVLGLAALGYVFYTSALDPQLGQPSLIANGAVVLLALVYYRFVLARKGGWVLRDADSPAP